MQLPAIRWTSVLSLQIEPYAEHSGMIGSDDLTGYTTYRIYALCENVDDLLPAFRGDSEFPTRIQSTTSFYQSGFGGLTGSTNAALFGFFPSAAFDLYITIGLPNRPVQEKATSTPSTTPTTLGANFLKTAATSPSMMKSVGAGSFSTATPTASLGMTSGFYWPRLPRTATCLARCTSSSLRMDLQLTTHDNLLIFSKLATDQKNWLPANTPTSVGLRRQLPERCRRRRHLRRIRGPRL